MRVNGSTKNEGTKLLAAALMSPGVTHIDNIPPVSDLDVMIELLESIGARVAWTGDSSLAIDATGPLEPAAPYALVSRMRASINVLGPLVARCGEARVALPGGDAIGSRKLDMHIAGLRAMSAQVEIRNGDIVAWTAGGLLGARHVLDFPSGRPTEHLLTARVPATAPTAG